MDVVANDARMLMHRRARFVVVCRPIGVEASKIHPASATLVHTIAIN
jgi:hypothetical protein